MDQIEILIQFDPFFTMIFLKKKKCKIYNIKIAKYNKENII